MANSVETTSFWFGYSIDYWSKAGSWLLVVAAFTGVIAAAAGGLSSWISSAVTSKVQVIAADRITAADLQLQRSKKRTAAANDRVSGLDVAVSEANARAEKAMIARVRLEAQIAPRWLPREQTGSLTAALVPFAGTSAKTFVYPSDGEGQRLEQQIHCCLTDAGFTVYGPQQNADPGELKSGVIIGTPPSAQAVAASSGALARRAG